MDDVNDKLAAQRREIEEVSQQVGRLKRTKADHEDFEAVSGKVAKMESDWRGKFDALHSDLQATNNNLRRVTHALEQLQATIETPPAPPPAPAPAEQRGGWPSRLQVITWVLAGVGLLALLQGAPQAFVTMMPKFATGGL